MTCGRLERAKRTDGNSSANDTVTFFDPQKAPYTIGVAAVHPPPFNTEP